VGAGATNPGVTNHGTADARDGCTEAEVLPDRSAPLAYLQTDLAWTVTRGAGVTVAVVDSGVDRTNAHLADAMAPGGTNLVPDPPTTHEADAPAGDPSRGGYADTSGHGTTVAGIIAARPLDGSGVVGLAPQAMVLPVRVYQSDTDRAAEQGVGPDAARTAQGIVYAADHGAQVVVVALSFPAEDPSLVAAVQHANDRGALVVASAGNHAANPNDAATDGPRWPAAAPGALGVAALDEAAMASASVHGPHVALAAPGHGVVAPANEGVDCAYGQTSTSWATAYAAGAAALVAAAYPHETPAQWAYRLTASAVRPDPDRRDDEVGWGAVQPYDALVLVPGAHVRGPQNPFTNTTPTPVTAAPGDLGPAPAGAGWTDSRQVAALVTVVAAVVFGVLAPVGVLRTRRAKATAAPLPNTGGVYRD